MKQQLQEIRNKLIVRLQRAMSTHDRQVTSRQLAEVNKKLRALKC